MTTISELKNLIRDTRKLYEQTASLTTEEYHKRLAFYALRLLDAEE